MEVVALMPDHVAGCLGCGIAARMVRLPDTLEGIETSLRSEAGFVAVDDGIVAAFVTTIERFPETIEITYLAVHAARRRGGLGRALILAVRDAAERAGAESICLLTLGPSSESIHYAETVRFYQAVGFWRTRESRLSDWGGAPALLMSAPLDHLG